VILQGVQLKLVNWEEGNYRVTDKPKPRGEVIIGGSCVADGYFLMPEKTKEDFFVENGRRWFRSGDIAQLEPEGTKKYREDTLILREINGFFF